MGTPPLQKTWTQFLWPPDTNTNRQNIQTFNLRTRKRSRTSLTFFVLGVYLLLLRCSPAGQFGGGDEEGQQRGEEAVVGHRQHEADQESCGNTTDTHTSATVLQENSGA